MSFLDEFFRKAIVKRTSTALTARKFIRILNADSRVNDNPAEDSTDIDLAGVTGETLFGDATGPVGSNVVEKVNGASIPAAGALATGNAAYVSGVSALTYSALNLAGGSGWVTGVLPKANQGAQDMGGDVTGSTAAAVVEKVHGASVPAAGSLTTGNAPYVSGSSALTYSALNLAGGSGWVTGVLPKANQGAQDMGGDVTGSTAAAVVAKVNGTTVPTTSSTDVGATLKVSAAGVAVWSKGQGMTTAFGNVAQSATSVTLHASTSTRIRIALWNDSDSILYVREDASAATTTSGVPVAPGGTYFITDYTGEIRGIWAAAGSGNCRYTEITP